MLNEAMKVADAQGRKAYDALIAREMHEYLLETPPDSWDIILAAGVLSYLGDAQRLFALVARSLKPGGFFAFTAEELQGNDFRFDASAARFRFSANYIRALAEAVGLKEVRFVEGPIYPNYNMWLCVFTK